MAKITVTIEDVDDTGQVKFGATFDPALTHETKEDDLTQAQRLGVNVINHMHAELQGGKVTPLSINGEDVKNAG